MLITGSWDGLLWVCNSLTTQVFSRRPALRSSCIIMNVIHCFFFPDGYGTHLMACVWKPLKTRTIHHCELEWRFFRGTCHNVPLTFTLPSLYCFLQNNRSFASFTPNGDYIISSSLSSTIRIWNFHSSKCLKTFTGHTNIKYSSPVCVMPKNQGQTNPSKKGKEQNGDQETDIPMASPEKQEVAEEPRLDFTEGYVISGSDESVVTIWDLQSREIVQRLEGGHKDTVLAVAVSYFLVLSQSLEDGTCSDELFDELGTSNKKDDRNSRSGERQIDRYMGRRELREFKDHDNSVILINKQGTPDRPCHHYYFLTRL